MIQGFRFQLLGISQLTQHFPLLALLRMAQGSLHMRKDGSGSGKPPVKLKASPRV